MQDEAVTTSNFRRRGGYASSLLVLFVSIFAFGDFDSTYLEDLVTYQNKLLHPASPTAPLPEQTRFRQELNAIISKLADDSFDSFLQDQHHYEWLPQIKDPLDQSVFYSRLNQIAPTRTFQILDSFRIPAISAFDSKAEAALRNGDFSFYVLQPGEILRDQIPAGYERGLHRVMVDLKKFDRSSWFTILIHEFTHAIDPELKWAVNDGYALTTQYPDLGVRIAKVGASGQPVGGQVDRDLVDHWLTLALYRGLFAEVTAWANTFDLYLELRRANRIQAIGYIDTILRNRQAQENMLRFCYRYFDQASENRTDGLFSYPNIQARSKEVQVVIAKKKGLIN